VSIDPEMTRRDFLRAGSMLGGGLVIAFMAPGPGYKLAAQMAFAAANSAFEPNAFLSISTDDSVRILLAHSEMGQGVWTTLPIMIAEELDVDWSKIRVEHAPAAPAYASPRSGMQMTVGSASTRSEFDRYRQAGAAARSLLLQAAAKRFNMKTSDLRTENGEVIAGERRIRYGALSREAASLRAPDLNPMKLKPSSEWKLIGKGKKRLDSPEKITGRAKFSLDIQFDGLLTALVAHPPVFGATVRSFDASATRAVPGVRNIVQVPTGVAVVADHYWAAKLGLGALKVDWDLGPHADLDIDRLREQFSALAGTSGTVAAQKGDIAAAMQGAVKTVEAEYFVPYLAHAPMEPLNCTVKIGTVSCDVWVGTQMQTLSQRVTAQITGLKPEQVHIHTTFLGGGFGRRAVQDFVSEAVQVAKAAGKPVKTVWTREDDIRGGYYRSAYVQRIRVGLDHQGVPVAWQQVIAGQAINGRGDRVDGTSVEGVVDSPYVTGASASRVDLHSPETGFPVWYWRSVGHSFNGFIMESMADELAHAAGQDPVEYRRVLLKHEPRYLGVLDLATERFGWKNPSPKGRGYGIAVHEAFGTVVAEAVEISVERGSIRVHRVVCAVDCGTAVNPDNVKAQMESAIVFGLGAALYGKLTIRNGATQESNFHDYKVLRMYEMPKVEVYIVPSDGQLGGAGEPGTPPIAPAVANAVFALTGQRLRELPLRLREEPSQKARVAPKHNIFALGSLLVCGLMLFVGCASKASPGSNAANQSPLRSQQAERLQRQDPLRAGLRPVSLQRSTEMIPESASMETSRSLQHARALQAFAVIDQVLQHPRCSNCHIPGDRPLQFDSQTPHAMNVMRGSDGNGSPVLHCSTCHGEANLPSSYGPHAPPGALNWHLPPADRKMAWIGLPPAQLCAIIKDKKRNGGRDFNALIEHVSTDRLVLWGWNPGGDRAPVPVPHDEFVTEFKLWAAAGGPCPAS